MLGLLARGVDLHEHRERDRSVRRLFRRGRGRSGGSDGGVELGRELEGVYRLDALEARDPLDERCGLVGLQVADEAPADVGGQGRGLVEDLLWEGGREIFFLSGSKEIRRKRKATTDEN